MESITKLLILLLLVAAAIAVIACLAIYNRKRRRPTQPAMVGGAQPTAVEETEPTAIAEAQSTAAAKQHLLVAKEAEPPAAGETQSTLVGETQAVAAPEAQLMGVQEAGSATVAETKHAGAEEAEPVAAEELLSAVAEETQPTVLEETQQQIPEEVPTKAEAVRRKPEERGGRPRGRAQSSEERPKEKSKQSGLKPEIVCWKRERQWIVGVEVLEDLLSNPGLEVLQNRQLLTRDESREGCWLLNEAHGQVSVRWIEVEVPKEIGDEDYLLFKLSGQDSNKGRQVKSPSSGWYLGVAPESWERDSALSGYPPVTPEPVSLAGYRAHFFEIGLSGNEKIAFRTPGGNSVVIETKAPRFHLWKHLNDTAEGIGPLFGEEPPKIRAQNVKAWKNVGTIVVGEEGSGKRRWKKSFVPEPDQIEQDLPSEVAARKSGWYFLRFYDTNDDLVESLDFRFISALREIKISQPPPLPSEGGHRPVCIEFLHEPCCTVQAADGLQTIQVNSQDDKTILNIPPDPTCDKTHWLVGSEDGPKVEVTILVERLWWAVGEEDKEPSEWEDQPFTLPRDDFAATSKKALWFRLPRRRWVNKILAGFEQAKARPYDVKVTEKTIAVPFREFGDSEEVGDRTQEHHFKVWIERDGRFMEGVVAIIPASPVPVQVVSPATPYWVGFGRKKTAVAEAVVQNGSGEIKINGQPIDRYFRGPPLKAKYFLWRLLELNQVHEALWQMEVLITVTGSSPTTARQAKAAAHALARALMSYDSKLKPLLKQAGFGGVRVTKVPTMGREG